MHRIVSIFAISMSQNQGFFHDMVEHFVIGLLYHMTMCLCAFLNTSTSKHNSKHVRNITTRDIFYLGMAYCTICRIKAYVIIEKPMFVVVEASGLFQKYRPGSDFAFCSV